MLFVNNREAKETIMKLCLLKMINLIFRKKNAFFGRFIYKMQIKKTKI